MPICSPSGFANLAQLRASSNDMHDHMGDKDGRAGPVRGIVMFVALQSQPHKGTDENSSRVGR